MRRAVARLLSDDIPGVRDVYFDTIDAPCKRLVWFDQSGHYPPFEEPEKFERVLNGYLTGEVDEASAGEAE